MRETSSSPWSIAGRSYPSYGSTDYRHPATYCESGSEAETRTVHLRDALLGVTLDLNRLTAEEREAVRAQITFMKEYRETIRFGNFYRFRSPFEGNFTAWIAVSLDRRTALVGWYRLLSGVNGPCRRIRLQGLDPDLCCTVDGSDVPLWRRADAGGPAGHGQRRRITASRNEENFSQRSCVEPWISSPELPAHM